MYHSQNSPKISAIIFLCNPMVSLKTKNTRTKRLFLIALFIFGGSTIALSAKSLLNSSNNTNSVKDSSVVLEDASLLEEGKVVDNIGTQDDKPVITTYVVKNGDSLSSIASQFSISINTILWANDLNKKSLIKPGQKLTILPVSGVVYAVGKGDTLSGIALKFDANVEEIVSFNDLEDDKPIKIGMKLIIPNAELPRVETKKEPIKQITATKAPEEKKEITQEKEVQKTLENISTNKEVDTDDMINNGAVPKVTVSGVNTQNYFSHPVPGSVLTQGIHGYNAVDFGAPLGTPVLAAADGVVIIEKGAGKWYGGYGNYIVIEHDNGTQTLYSHNSKNLVNVGDEIKQGQKIALVGSTGRSTGNHLHFEVRGGTNPWVGIKKLTQF